MAVFCSTIPDGNALLSINNLWTETLYDGQAELGIGNRTGQEYVGKISQSKVYLLDGKNATTQLLPTTFYYDVFGRISSQNGNNHVNVLSGQISNLSNNYNYQYDWADNARWHNS